MHTSDPDHLELKISENPLFEDRDYRLWALLHQTRHVIHEAISKEMATLGVSPRQVAALLIIEAIEKPATPSRISYWLMRDRASVSVLLDRMERKGLIKKEGDPNNKKIVSISLTEKGRQIHQRMLNSQIIRELFSSLSDKQHEQLMKCLDILWGKAHSILGVKKPELPFI